MAGKKPRTRKKSKISPKNIEELQKEGDALLDRMQTPESRAAMKAAFDASPEELGKAAVKAARSRSSRKRKKNRH